MSKNKNWRQNLTLFQVMLVLLAGTMSIVFTLLYVGIAAAAVVAVIAIGSMNFVFFGDQLAAIKPPAKPSAPKH